MTADLDTFERRLLADLRTEVASRTHVTPAPLRGRRPRRLAAGATAAVVAGGGWIGVALLATPAYAVGEGPGGVVEVQVNRLEDAAGLQRALEERGIAAEVQYLGTDLRCQPDRYRDAASVPDSQTRFTVGQDRIEVVLDPRDIGEGRTVVIAASTTSPAGDLGDGTSDLGGIWAEVGVAAGPVQACVPVPLEPGDVA